MAQCQRVVALVIDWWNDMLCWRSTPFTLISLLLSTVLVLHSIIWGMGRARVEVVIASLTCVFLLFREAVHTVVDAKPANPEAPWGFHYVLVRNIYSILLFALSVLLVLHAQAHKQSAVACGFWNSSERLLVITVYGARPIFGVKLSCPSGRWLCRSYRLNPPQRT